MPQEPKVRIKLEHPGNDRPSQSVAKLESPRQVLYLSVRDIVGFLLALIVTTAT